jgi:hypothetical protein
MNFAAYWFVSVSFVSTTHSSKYSLKGSNALLIDLTGPLFSEN